MRKALICAMMVAGTGLVAGSGSVFAEDGSESNLSENEVKSAHERGVHFEPFTVPIIFYKENSGCGLFLNLLAGVYLNRTRIEGDGKLHATLPIFDINLTSGSQWWKDSPMSDWTFTGFGIAAVTGGDSGVLQLRLNVVGRRIVGNFWATTGVGFMPFSGQNHFGWTVGLQSWIPDK